MTGPDCPPTCSCRGSYHESELVLDTEEVARRASRRVAASGGDLSVLTDRELGALAAVLISRLDPDQVAA